MTRDEFINDVRDIDDLQDFCDEIGCSTLEGVYSPDYYDEWIEDQLVDLARNNTWRDLYGILSNFDDDAGYDFYMSDEYGDLKPIEFEDIKDQVLDWADYNAAWDEMLDDDDEERELSEEERYEIEPTEEEDCTVMEMFVESRNCVQTLTPEQLEALGNGLRATMELVAE